MGAAILYIVLAAIGTSEVAISAGEWVELAQAQQTFHEVYGARIAAAVTSESKRQLARELLSLAHRETDFAAFKVEIEAARDLAMQAGDISLAVGLVREIAVKIPDDSLSDDELAREAERVWAEAGALNGADQVAKRLRALELWFRVGRQSAIQQQRWEKRIEQLILGQRKIGIADRRFLASLNGAVVALVNYQSGFTINVCRDDPNPGAMIIQWDEPDSQKNSHWIIEVMENGFCRLRNRSSGLFLVVEEDAESGARSVTQGAGDTLSALWLIQRCKGGTVRLINPASNSCLCPEAPSSDRGVRIIAVPENEITPWGFWQIMSMPVS